MLDAAGAFFFLAISSDTTVEDLPRADNVGFFNMPLTTLALDAGGSAGGILFAGTNACVEEMKDGANKALAAR